jgi:TatA/E family protein of Tat protein translocase
MGSLGMPEILMILVIALIIFGPRKLPELGKTLGQSLAQFRRASEDFKRQWEDEVELERRRIEPPNPAPIEHSSYSESSESSGPETTQPITGEPAVHSEAAVAEATATAKSEKVAPQETKHDWM